MKKEIDQIIKTLAEAKRFRKEAEMKYKPCPFCGNTSEEEFAIKKWNTRSGKHGKEY